MSGIMNRASAIFPNLPLAGGIKTATEATMHSNAPRQDFTRAGWQLQFDILTISNLQEDKYMT